MLCPSSCGNGTHGISDNLATSCVSFGVFFSLEKKKKIITRSHCYNWGQGELIRYEKIAHLSSRISPCLTLHFIIFSKGCRGTRKNLWPWRSTSLYLHFCVFVSMWSSEKKNTFPQEVFVLHAYVSDRNATEGLWKLPPQVVRTHTRTRTHAITHTHTADTEGEKSCALISWKQFCKRETASSLLTEMPFCSCQGYDYAGTSHWLRTSDSVFPFGELLPMIMKNK